MGPIEWYRSRVILADRRVSADHAETTLLALRWLSYAVWVAAMGLGGMMIYRWPRYKAEAIRILVERQLTSAVYSQQIYSQVARGRRDQALNLSRTPEFKTPEGAKHFLALDAIRGQMIQRAAAQTPVIQAAQKAQAQIPGRLSAGVLWADPLTGVALPEGISREEGVNRLLAHWRNLPEHEEWLRAVASLTKNHSPEPRP